MTDEVSTNGREAGPTVSRRNVLKTGGSALAAMAVVSFGGVGLSKADPPGRNLSRDTLRASDPHASTARRRPRRPGAGALPVDGGGQASVRILPIDRAKFLVGGRFDLRVEIYGVEPEGTEVEIRVEGPSGPAAILPDDPERTSSEPDSLEVTFTGVSYADAGSYTIVAEVISASGSARTEVSHEVVLAEARDRKAHNVIFFLGDGMGQPAITAARILSKGMTEGKYHGLLEMDQMDALGHIGTSGMESIATDSANSMSAYMTGHKSEAAAMGVYPANAPDPDDHPRVETMAELLKRSLDMAIGIVSTAEIQDATPAAVFAHTRERAEYVSIMDQALQDAQRADVILGGGSAALLPRSEADSAREDDRDLRQEFRDLGYTYVDTRTALLEAAEGGPPRRLLGTFHPENLDVFLDRTHPQRRRDDLDFPDQPSLVEMTEVALAALEDREEGFFLMVEAASIDKMEHPMDGPRVVYDTIEFDQAIGVAKRWAEGRDDTLIVVTADHNHSMSIVGTHDRRDTPTPDRQGNKVYGDSGFPTYVDVDGDGYPDDPDPDVQLFFGWSNHPDHTDDFQHNDEFDEPALLDDTERAVDNPDRDPEALEQIGNLPYDQTNCVHTVEDVSVFASGPGASRFNGFLDNTEIFFAIADALELRPPVDDHTDRAAERNSTSGSGEAPARAPGTGLPGDRRRDPQRLTPLQA